MARMEMVLRQLELNHSMNVTKKCIRVEYEYIRIAYVSMQNPTQIQSKQLLIGMEINKIIYSFTKNADSVFISIISCSLCIG